MQLSESSILAPDSGLNILQDECRRERTELLKSASPGRARKRERARERERERGTPARYNIRLIVNLYSRGVTPSSPVDTRYRQSTSLSIVVKPVPVRCTLE